MEQAAELRDVMRRCYDAIARGEAAALEGLFTRGEDVVVIGTDPREWWTGRERAVGTFTTQVREMGGQLQAAPGELRAGAEGAVGWVADNPTFRLADGTELPLRITAVFRREDGAWRCAQWHASMGVSNEEAIGQDLTV
jgi:ketosteroid isomerase-like protein